MHTGLSNVKSDEQTWSSDRYLVHIWGRVNVATYLFFSAICCTYAVVMNKIRDVQSVCYKKEMVKNAELSIQFSEHDSCWKIELCEEWVLQVMPIIAVDVYIAIRFTLWW